MKREYLGCWVAVGVLMGGCPNRLPTNPSGETSFTTSEDVSGTNPEAAQFAVFGAEVLSNQGKIVVFASDDPDPCTQLGADPVAFLIDMLGGNQAGTFVLISISDPAGLPTAGETIEGDGQNLFVGFSFLVSDGSQSLSDVSMSLQDGTFEVGDFSVSQTLSATASGELDVGTPQPVLFSGSVVGAAHCQVLTDALSQF